MGAQTDLGFACQAGGAASPPGVLHEQCPYRRACDRCVLRRAGWRPGRTCRSYRGYALDSSLSQVGDRFQRRRRADRALTLHRRPATIQELERRAPCTALRGRALAADSVRGIRVQLLQRRAVSTGRELRPRTRPTGLTSRGFLIESLSVTYGATDHQTSPATGSAHPPALADAVCTSQQWEDGAASVTLLKDSYSPQYQAAPGLKAAD